MASFYDVTIIGGGIVGLATALKIGEAHPRVKLLILEKEPDLARHQTGHNSGVIHSGLYYRPGSVKARSCVAGRKALMEFCDRNGVPYEICGKVVVASSAEELSRLEELHRRGLANGLQGLEIIGPERLREFEPHAAGVKALCVPQTGIIDYKKVAAAYAEKIRANGGDIRTSHRVVGVIEGDGELVAQTSMGDYRTKYLINCCGLQSDLMAKMMRVRDGEHRIIPFRGEYYKLAPQRHYLVRNLIYPVPDPAFPFLGVHFTRMANGGVEAGPNAVLAYAREGYCHTAVNLGDLWQTVSFKGFWAMAGKYWRTGFGELHRSLSKAAFVKALQKLLPEIKESDLVAGGAGVRAQAVSASGALVDDFVIQQGRRSIHVLNAPSPGATASLAIGQTIAEMAAKNFGL
ncbi:MAG: L-2-hydroxyglutarate oxidase [Deltaproteobacteria bacterium]|nr:L-2-hydroxyglutarate oxidase [Deltaproteobacteria bacterium]MBI2228238.1 L-2-hydroxyglutarate oxidase [Deltaproteobacteria bacterium]MBI3063768.1 L-2-hydroxyglutarate oxidase [Deltaproteobacteria bacterium]